MDRHYLLYATSGSMRLQADGRRWTLPPARVALIAAKHPVTVTLPNALNACSALFDPAVFPPPHTPLSVFEITPLARELILECRNWTDPNALLPSYATQIFATLATVAWRLAETPSPTAMPAPATDPVRRALDLLERDLAAPPAFKDLAATLAITPRTLARRLSAELGMNFRQLLRRLRMIHAVEALTDPDRPVTDIAFATGYASLSAFNAAFRDFTGHSPTSFRSSFRAEAEM